MKIKHFETPKGVQLLGDPHLGKKFNSHVPRERLGEREEMVRKQFLEELEPIDDTITDHICMGDLFDKFRVPEEVILFAAQAYRDAAARNPNIEYYIIRGNHDASRDSSFKSSFDVFEALLEDVDGVNVISEEPLHVISLGQEHTLYPWHPFIHAKEMVELHPPTKGGYVYGHWDILAFEEGSSSEENFVPTEHFKECAGIYTGHYHLPKAFPLDGMTINITGSMQPYTHAEDEVGELYRTESLPEVVATLSANPEHYKYVNLRVLLGPDEVPLADIDCLSYRVKRMQKDEQENIDVDIESFNLESIFKNTMSDFKVSDETTSKLWTRFLSVNEAE